MVYSILKGFATVVLLFTTSFVFSQSHTIKFTKPSGGIPYWEYLPPGYQIDDGKQYPVLIFLHGKGEKGTGTVSDMQRVLKLGPPKHITNGHNMCFTVNGKEECFVVISPQLSSSAGSWYPNYFFAIVKHIINGSENYKIDPNRVYLTGLSLGGNGVYYNLFDTQNDPNYFAAAVPVAARGVPTNGCIISERGVPIWHHHGDQDTTVPFSSGLAMFDAIKDCTTPSPTAELIFTTYPGLGHSSWDPAYKTDNSLHNPNIYQWLLTKSLGGLPVASAGEDKTIQLPTNSITFNGTANDPGGAIVSYSWAQINGPSSTLTNSSTPSLTVGSMVEGTYTFRLTVQDNDGNLATDDVMAVVNSETFNFNPTVSAGNDKSITLPTSTTILTGTAGDSDGTIVTRAWTQISGPSSATLSGQSTNSLTASNLIQGTYTFRFTAVDDDGASTNDDAQVIVNGEPPNQIPTALAGPDISLTLPTNSTTINGSGTDPDGTIVSYSWEKVNGPGGAITNSMQNISLTSLVEGTYKFRLTVVDNDGGSDIDDVQIFVEAGNQNPMISTSGDQTLTLPNNTTNINAIATDVDGTIISYFWSFISGPSSPSLNNQNQTTVTVGNLMEGEYTFRIQVADNEGATAFADVKINVVSVAVNIPPVANAGPDRIVNLPLTNVAIIGSGSDSDGSISVFSWIQISGPTVTLTDTDKDTLSASALLAGAYEFELTVTDNDSDSDIDVMQLTVVPETVNEAPISSAGSDQTITLPLNSIVLTGSGMDNDGSVVSYLWVQKTGPNTAGLSGITTDVLSISSMIEGIYTFALTVTDDEGATDSDDVMVSVNAQNLPPVVSAGNDININLPTNSLVISGLATDADGSIVTYAWTQRSGAVATLGNTNQPQLSVSDLLEGTYVFRLVATDDDGISAFDEVTINVLAASTNILPLANAGTDIEIILPTDVANLSGVGTDSDGTITNYLWEIVSGASVIISNSTNSTATVSGLIEGSYEFVFTVTDDLGGKNSDNVLVVVIAASVNQSPTAFAGSDQELTLPTNSINLVGFGQDPDGSITSYLWTQTSGPSGTLSNTNSSTLSLSNLIEGTYTFRLTVTDDQSATHFDEVNVVVQPASVNQAPVASAGNDKEIKLPNNSVEIIGSGSDGDGSIISHLWNQIGGPSTGSIDDPSSSTIIVSNLIEGVYTFRLEVTDDMGAKDTDQVLVTVLGVDQNESPIANAGSDITISLPTNSATITGTGSDPDGSINAYKWLKVTGPSLSLVNDNTSIVTTNELLEGSYLLRLTVTDDKGATGADDVVLRVLAENVNLAPEVSIGSDISIFLPDNTIDITASASDTDGTIVTFLWTQESGSFVTLNNTNLSTLSVSDLIEGIYIFRITVTDEDGASAFDEVKLTVLPVGTNQIPLVSAGPNKSINLPTNSVTLNGSATDDGSIVSYLWNKVSGPAATLSDTSLPDLDIIDMSEGTYIFSLEATDNDGAKGFDEVTVNLFPESLNQSPSADAGVNETLFLPNDNTILNGSGSDPDGTISSYSWTKKSGPVEGTFTGLNSPTVELTNLVVGTYIFELKVTDNDGALAVDEVTIFVNEELGSGETNEAPIADAGVDKVVTLPDNEVILAGAGSDDFFLDIYQWEQTSGSPAVLTNLNNDTLTVSNLQEGAYSFQFTVTDNEGLSDSDEVEILVQSKDAALEKGKSSLMFTPNGDGVGDSWVFVDDPNTISNCSLAIFDRQGNMVFQADGYTNNWNGTLNGSPLPADVYYYIIKCEGGDSISSNGSITILR